MYHLIASFLQHMNTMYQLFCFFVHKEIWHIDMRYQNNSIDGYYHSIANNLFFSSSLFKVTCVRRQQQEFQPNVQMVSTSHPLGRFPVCSVPKDTSVQIKP